MFVMLVKFMKEVAAFALYSLGSVVYAVPFFVIAFALFQFVRATATPEVRVQYDAALASHTVSAYNCADNGAKYVQYGQFAGPTDQGVVLAEGVLEGELGTAWWYRTAPDLPTENAVDNSYYLWLTCLPTDAGDPITMKIFRGIGFPQNLRFAPTS